MKKLSTAIKKFVISNAFPMLKELYFLIIMAIMSVPPLEDPRLNRIEDPKDGRDTAKMNSSIGWSVNGCAIGKRYSKIEIPNESTMLQYAVFAITDLPRTKTPRRRRAMLAIRLNWLAVRIPVFPTNTERPVIPPKVKLLVNLKK